MRKFISRVKRTSVTVIVGIHRTVIAHAYEIYQALHWVKAIYDCLKLLFPQLPDLLDLL